MEMKAHVFGHAKHAARLLMSVVAALAMILGVFGMAQPVAADSELECSEHTLSVTLAPGATDTYHVVGTLCSLGPVDGKTLQLLLHGGTYARYYWDFPYQPDHYSYVRAATKRGYATFNLDRIGNGASDHPAGDLVDFAANAYVVHQVVEALRAGEIASTHFGKIILVGHSMGSFTTVQYAGTYPGEVQGIILTGYLHDLNMTNVNSFVMPAFYSANDDPKFAGLYPNNDYLTTRVGKRGEIFYYLPNADPAVIAVDENLKQTATSGEFATFGNIVYGPISLNIKGPVQEVVGQYDALFCGGQVNCSDKAAVQTFEEGKFSSSVCLETAVVNDSGHDVNLQLNAGAAYSQMLAWADRTVGSTTDPAPQPCTAP